MTPLSPLQLKQHSFTRIEILANPKGAATGQVSLTPELSYQKDATNPNQWMLGLRVILKSASFETPFFYEVDINVQGLVEMNEAIAAEKREQIAVVNGLSILYSAIREMLLNITSRSVHGALGLPTLSFVDALTQHIAQEKKEKEHSPATPPADTQKEK